MSNLNLQPHKNMDNCHKCYAKNMPDMNTDHYQDVNDITEPLKLFSIVVTVVIHRCHNFVALLISFFPWHLAYHFLVL